MKTIITLLVLSVSLRAATCTYDDAGQLIAESYSNGAHAFYQYDDIGNPLSRTTIAPNANPQANLAITHAVSPDPLTAGSAATITFTVTNNGPDPATEVTLTDILPNEFTPASATSTQGNCEIAGQTLTCQLGTLANTQSVIVTVIGTVQVAGNFATTATVTAPEESDASDNETTTNTPVTGGVDLAFSLSQHGPEPALNTGTTLIFLARAINRGPNEATNVVHTFTLPPEFTFLAAFPEQGSSHNAGVVIRNLGNISAGAEVQTIVFANPTGTTGTFTTTSSLAAVETDLDPTDNTTSFVSDVLAPTLTVTNTDDAGTGSLRQAILEANADPGADVIGFELPQNTVQTIVPLTNLPALTEPVMIDGFSAAAGLVEIDGTNLTDGLTLEASDTCLRGLVINRCGSSAIQARGIDGDRLTGITIEGCLLGLNAAGDADLGNGDHGIDFAFVNDSRIGGRQFWQANTISGNDNHGILIADTCNNLTIAGNRIGTDLAAEAALGNTDSGILFQGTNSLIGGTGLTDGNVISGNGDFGLDLSGEGNRIFQNQIGTDFDGTDAIPNGEAANDRAGVAAQSLNLTNPHVIGGITERERNLISGNDDANVRLGPGVVCVGNFIGPNITGNALLNDRPFALGVELRNGATLGGILPGQGNVISGNRGSGICLQDFIPEDSFVLGNKIGVGTDGTTDLGNAGSGIVINSAAGAKHIGFDVEGAGNLISGNNDEGIHLHDLTGGPIPENVAIMGNKIGTDEAGTAAVPNGDNGILIVDGTSITIGSPITAGRNLISGNIDAGIQAVGGLTTVTNVRVEGNYIGTDTTGSVALGNLRQGIDFDAENCTIIDNLVSGNSNGSFVDGGIDLSGDTFTVQGNKIGTDVTGKIAIPNDEGLISFASNVLIGGIEAGQGNLISGNHSQNLETSGSPTIAGNIIGADIDGSAAPTGSPNSAGARLSGDGGTFGLASPGGGNLVSGNFFSAVSLVGDNWVCQNNLLGTTGDGLLALANRDGFSVSGDNNLIGGGDLLDGNLISGNREVGILEFGEGNTYQGNTIGLNASSEPLGNGEEGFHYRTGSGTTLLGGTAPGEGNTIAHSGLEGVRVQGGFSTSGNLTILGNAIFANGGLGIDLTDGSGSTDGVTPNDPLDADTSTNSLQNFPVITTAGNTITGTLNSEPNKTYRIELFSNNAADESGHGEGKVFLGHHDVTTDGDGSAAFTFNPVGTLANGQFVTATATNPDGQTSEFGAALIITGGGTFADTDGDGMSDDFELEHFGTIIAGDPSADLDGDGQDNLAEFLTLTDPNDGSSAFEVVGQDEGDSFVIVIQTEVGRVYQLSQSDDLGGFDPLGDPVVGDGGLVELVHENPGLRRFYQITVSFP